MFDYFLAQTYVAAFDIDLNIFFEVRPIVFPADELSCFVNTKMCC